MGRTLRIGLFSPYFGATVGGGEKYLAVTAEALRDRHPRHRVEIVGAVPADRERYRTMLDVDLDRIELGATNRRVTPLHRLANGISFLRPLRNLVLGRQARDASAGYDLLLAMVYAIPIRSRARRSVLLCQFPDRNPEPADLAAYELIVCQSEYVRHWVGEYWHRTSEVVNPPIDLPPGAPVPGDRDNVILGVGRFFAGGHTKRQDFLVESFRNLCDRGLANWELHLAGSVHREAVHAGYFEAIAERARGYPIVLHPDLGHVELEWLYSRAAIFWHAAGFGADAAGDPAALEHFGMTTAEAMGAGAVPLAFGRGGQAEVIEDGVDGFLWQTPAELEQRTLQLIAEPALRERMSEAASLAARRYSRSEFKRRMLALLDPIVAELEAEPEPIR